MGMTVDLSNTTSTSINVILIIFFTNYSICIPSPFPGVSLAYRTELILLSGLQKDCELVPVIDWDGIRAGVGGCYH